jgi:hypothetical protein
VEELIYERYLSNTIPIIFEGCSNTHPLLLIAENLKNILGAVDYSPTTSMKAITIVEPYLLNPNITGGTCHASL